MQPSKTFTLLAFFALSALILALSPAGLDGLEVAQDITLASILAVAWASFSSTCKGNNLCKQGRGTTLHENSQFRCYPSKVVHGLPASHSKIGRPSAPPGYSGHRLVQTSSVHRLRQLSGVLVFPGSSSKGWSNFPLDPEVSLLTLFGSWNASIKARISWQRSWRFTAA